MKILFKNYPLIIFTIGLAFISCKKKNQDMQNETVGTVSGMVYCLDPTGLNNLPLRNAEVTIIEKKITAITDSNGNFNLINVPAGNYTILYSKTGFGDVKTFNFYFSGTGQTNLDKTKMTMRPLFKFNNLKDSINYTISANGDTSYALNGFFTITNPDSLDMNYDLLLGYNQNINIDTTNIISTLGDRVNAKNLIRNFSYDITNEINHIKIYGVYKHHSKVYLKIIPLPSQYANSGYYGDYLDPIKGMQYTSIGDPLVSELYLP